MVIINALTMEGFSLPKAGSGSVYYRILDTSRPYGQDLLADEDAAPLHGRFYRVAPQSVVILVSKVPINDETVKNNRREEELYACHYRR